MTDDIVTRLRTECEAWDCKNIDEPCLTSDAADEIERLRNIVDEQSATIRHLALKMERMLADE